MNQAIDQQSQQFDLTGAQVSAIHTAELTESQSEWPVHFGF